MRDCPIRRHLDRFTDAVQGVGRRMDHRAAGEGVFAEVGDILRFVPENLTEIEVVEAG
ncbi:MAG: hypothetical protein ABI808_02775 [Pseudonocardiales bacterium]